MKKRAGAAALLLALCMGVTSVCAMPEANTQFVGRYIEITISGTLQEGQEGKPVALMIYREGSDTALHVDQVISGEGGSYQFRLTGNPDWRDGTFRYEVTSLEEEAQNGLLELPDVKIKCDVLEQLNAAQNVGDVRQAMEGKELGLNLPVFEQVSKSTVYEGVYEYVKAGGRFEDLNAMDTKIKEQIVLAALNQAVSGIQDQGKLQYLGLIGIADTLVQRYRNELSAKGLAGVNRQMLSKGFVSAQQAAQRFEAVLYTNLITGYKSVGTGHIEPILKDHGNLLGIDYAAFVAKGKPVSVLQTLINSGAATPETLAQVFADAINSYVPGSGGPNGGGGGGGGSHTAGGGASTGGSYLPPVDPVLPVQTPDMPPQLDTPGGFTDIADVAWAKDAIVSLKQAGVINGKTETEFAPDDNVTREEFVKMLVTALKLTDEGPYVLPFGDVKEGDWYYEPIRVAAKNHIVSGMGESWFGVGEDITRQDMVTIAFRALRLTNVTMDTDVAAMAFEDQTMIAEYAVPAARVFKKMNLISGYEDGAFRPMAKTTRAEAAKLIYNMLQLKGVA